MPNFSNLRARNTIINNDQKQESEDEMPNTKEKWQNMILILLILCLLCVGKWMKKKNNWEYLSIYRLMKKNYVIKCKYEITYV